MPSVDELRTRLDEIVDKFYAYVRRIVGCKVSSPEDADDVVQEVFIAVVRNIRTAPAAKSDFRRWLDRIINNKVIDFYRRRSTAKRTANLYRPSQHDDASLESLAIDMRELDPEGGLELDELRSSLAKVLKQLTKLQRDVIFLRYWDDLSEEEIAVNQGCPAATVKTRLRDARRRIRQIYGNTDR